MNVQCHAVIVHKMTMAETKSQCNALLDRDTTRRGKKYSKLKLISEGTVVQQTASNLECLVNSESNLAVTPGSMPVTPGSMPVPSGSMPVTPGSMPVPSGSMPVTSGNMPETLDGMSIAANTPVISRCKPFASNNKPCTLNGMPVSSDIVPTAELAVDYIKVSANNRKSNSENIPPVLLNKKPLRMIMSYDWLKNNQVKLEKKRKEKEVPMMCAVVQL